MVGDVNAFRKSLGGETSPDVSFAPQEPSPSNTVTSPFKTEVSSEAVQAQPKVPTTPVPTDVPNVDRFRQSLTLPQGTVPSIQKSQPALSSTPQEQPEKLVGPNDFPNRF